MAGECGSCGGNHVGKCSGVKRTCGECGASFIAGNGWHNHFLCSFSCCATRRAKLNPIQDDDGYY